MSTLYKFSRAAYWCRPDEGPLIVPIFPRPQAGAEKEKTFGSAFVNYLEWLNSPKGFAHIVSPTYGPSRGMKVLKIGKKILSRRIRLVMAVYPGPDNFVSISSVQGDWGVIDGCAESKIPSRNLTHASAPWLIHKVYGSNPKETAVLLKDDIFVPVMSTNRFIHMSWLERV